VMDVLRHRLNLRIPEDVSVVGFDDVQLAAWPSFDLTTVRQPSGRMVDATVDALVDKIENGEAAPQRVQVDARLIVRGSARLPETPVAELERE
jgi:DNA-binding LacI/PurR family transcriptional regulator